MPDTQGKWQRRPDDRPTEIMAAALKVFSDKGFHAATMDEIAAEAGVTKGTIYLYFPGKEELFIDMAKAQLHEAVGLLPQIKFEPDDDPEALTKRIGKSFLDVLLRPDVAKTIHLILSEFNHLPGLRKIYQDEVMPQANMQLAGLLELGMALGIVKKLDPVIAARSLFGMFFVFVLTQEILGAKDVTPMSTEDIVNTVVPLYFRGLLEEGIKQ